jgi:hypothetical protein
MILPEEGNFQASVGQMKSFTLARKASAEGLLIKRLLDLDNSCVWLKDMKQTGGESYIMGSTQRFLKNFQLDKGG